MGDHPRVVFRPTPRGGRVAGIIGGPDVAEVVTVIRDLEATGDAAVEQAAEWLGLSERDVRAAIGYYADFPDEIDNELALRDRVAAEAGARWEREQRLLS